MIQTTEILDYHRQISPELLPVLSYSCLIAHCHYEWFIIAVFNSLNRSAALIGVLALAGGETADVAHPLLGLNIQILHELIEGVDLLRMRVCLFPTEWNPLDVILLILACIHAHPNLVLQACVLCLVLVEEAVEVVDVVPEEVLLVDVVVELLVVLL